MPRGRSGAEESKEERKMSEPPVVSALIETFTSMLAEKVLKEVSLITSFKKDFEFLCDELFSVKLLSDRTATRVQCPIGCKNLRIF